MNDELLMNNYLLNLKSTVEVYVHGTLESSNQEIREILKTSLDTTLTNQADTYSLMTKNNWYSINNLDSNTINKTFESLKEKNTT